MNWLSNVLNTIGDFVMDNIVDPIVDFFSSAPSVDVPVSPPAEMPTAPVIPKSPEVPTTPKAPTTPDLDKPDKIPHKEPSPSKKGKSEKAKKKGDTQKPEKKDNCVEEEECKNKCITEKQIKKIFPHASVSRRTQLYVIFNTYCKKFNINTKLRVAHFFAQIKEEVGERITFKNENLNYSAKRLKSKVSLIDIDGRRKSKGPFSYFWKHHKEADLYGKTNKQNANQKAIANRAYAYRNGNGNINSNDGWNFRGKGFIQLTGRSNYEKANKDIQKYASESKTDIIQNPSSILTIKGAMLASMGYWTSHNLNNISDTSGWSSADKVTNIVNRYTDSRKNRNTNLKNIKKILK